MTRTSCQHSQLVYVLIIFNDGKCRELEEIVERHSTLESANIDLSDIQMTSETRIEEPVSIEI